MQANASVTAADNNDWTALHVAAVYGKAQVVDLLPQDKASSTAVTKYGDTPAQRAEQRGHTELAKRLRQAQSSTAST